MDFRVFNIHKDVNACRCTWGCTDTEKESALKVDSGKKNPVPYWGIKSASVGYLATLIGVRFETK